MAKKLLLAGYFGSGNLGDDAILSGFMTGLDGFPYETRVIAGNPDRLMRNYGYQSVGKFDNEALSLAMSECDALVFPGGSIFQDVTSVRSVYYYSNLVKQAKKAGKKVILLGQGIGPLNRWLGKRFAVQAFELADAIAVRDPASGASLKALGVRQSATLTGDMAWLLKRPVLSEDSSNFNVAGMKTVGISVRPFGKDGVKTVTNVFGELVKLLYAGNFVPVMIAMDETEDRKVIDAIAKLHGGKVPEIKNIGTAQQAQQRIMRMEAVIGMRLHAGILAATVGVPPYMISYDPKVTAFANSLGYSNPPTMQGITASRIFDGFQTFIKDHDRLVASIEKKRDDFVEGARQNIDVLRSALGD